MFNSELCTHLSSVPILWNFLNTLFGPEILHFRVIEFLKIVSWNNHAKYDPAELQGLFIPVKFSSLWGSNFGIMEGVQDEGDEGSEEEEGDESDEADDITGLFLQIRYGRNTTSWKRVNYR